MKIHLVSLEDGITAIGFRRIAAFVEQINKDTRVFYVGTRCYQSLSKWIRRSMGQARRFGSDEIDEIAPCRRRPGGVFEHDRLRRSDKGTGSAHPRNQS